MILLDTRSFRSPLQRRPAAEFAANRALGPYVPSTATDQAMLGSEQWAWLEARLREPADLRLIVSSIQVLAETHGWERWGNLPSEQRRLYDLIDRTGAKGVVLISGDRHRAAIYAKADKRPYAIPEITSSALNLPFDGDDAPDPGRLTPMFKAENFGTITIDWAGRRLQATLNDLGGRVIASHDVTFGDLAR